MNWRHFKRWSKKLNRLKELEKQIYLELDMEDKLLVIQGNNEDPDKIRTILTEQKENLSLKFVSISNREEFERRFNEVIND